MSSTSAIEKIDFEHLSTLASTNPQKFEEIRQDKISDAINGAPASRQQRLVGLQWRIDAMRAQHKESPIAACLAISELMWDTFTQLSEALKAQQEPNSASTASIMKENIITFPTKSEN